MINYRGIQIFNILFGIVIADTVALAFTLQSDLYIWPLIILIAQVSFAQGNEGIWVRSICSRIRVLLPSMRGTA